MVIPWLGIPLRDMIDRLEQLSRAGAKADDGTVVSPSRTAVAVSLALACAPAAGASAYCSPTGDYCFSAARVVRNAPSR